MCQSRVEPRSDPRFDLCRIYRGEKLASCRIDAKAHV